MTQAHSHRLQLAAQGALQAIITHGGEAGYSHKIEIITEFAIFVHSSFGLGENALNRTRRIDLTGMPEPLKQGYDAAFKNILSIEHERGRCVDGK